MLSHSRHMGACVYHSIGQVDPRFGNLVEWKWCHCVECLRLVFIWTTSNIHMRRIQKVFEPFVWCLKGILWMHPYTHVKVHWPSCPQIWEFRVPCGVEMMSVCHHGWGWWYHLPQTTSNIHIRYVQSVWAIGVLSQQGQLGAPVYF